MLRLLDATRGRQRVRRSCCMMYAVRARMSRTLARRALVASRSIAARRFRHVQWYPTPLTVVANSASFEHHAQTVMGRRSADPELDLSAISSAADPEGTAASSRRPVRICSRRASRIGLSPGEERMEGNQPTALYNIATIVMILALVADFAWVISTAVRTMAE